MRRQKSLRNGVHHADAVVWGPVYRTHLNTPRDVSGGVARSSGIFMKSRSFSSSRRSCRNRITSLWDTISNDAGSHTFPSFPNAGSQSYTPTLCAFCETNAPWTTERRLACRNPTNARHVSVTEEMIGGGYTYGI
eukprot:29658-Pelagococcus_subviridis.AAC.6